MLLINAFVCFLFLFEILKIKKITVVSLGSKTFKYVHFMQNLGVWDFVLREKKEREH